MNRILLAFDGYHFSKEALGFVRELNELQPVMVNGMFLPEIAYPGAYGFAGTASMEMPSLKKSLEAYDEETLEANVNVFKDLCEQSGIAYTVHKCLDEFTVRHLKKETRFSDVMIVSNELFRRNTLNSETDEYIEITLHHSECPVLVLPEQCDFPDHIVLAYDGSASSVYAIKLFSYLFPELCRKSTLLVYASKKEHELPDREYIEELASRHFSKMDIMNLRMDPAKYFGEWVSVRKKPLLVAGSFERSPLSELLKKSFAGDVIKEHKVPVFIAHK